MQQLFDGVYILEGEVGGRPLQLVYLKGDSASLLMDTGCAHDPSKFIARQIGEAGGNAADLTWILNTHRDLERGSVERRVRSSEPRILEYVRR